MGISFCTSLLLTESACRLYFDLEFKLEFNPHIDPIALLETFIQVYIFNDVYISSFFYMYSHQILFAVCVLPAVPVF